MSFGYTGKILHVDFQRISLDEAVRVEVAVTLRGSLEERAAGGPVWT